MGGVSRPARAAEGPRTREEPRETPSRPAEPLSVPQYAAACRLTVEYYGWRRAFRDADGRGFLPGERVRGVLERCRRICLAAGGFYDGFLP